MREIENWSKIISIVTIISGVLVSLIPKSKLTSAYKTMVAILLIYLFISPFSSLIKNINSVSFRAPDYIEDDMLSIANEPIFETAETIINDKIEAVLSEKGYNIKCAVSLNENDSHIHIDEIIIYGNFSKNEKANIKEIISDFLETAYEIKFSGEIEVYEY